MIYNGTVLAYSLYIRDAPSGNALGGLKKDDVITADGKIDGWWHLTSITRAGVPVPLPGAECYSYEGSTNGYIRQDSVVGGDTVTVEIWRDGVLIQTGEVDEMIAQGILSGVQTIDYQYP